jgi:glycosyltransferase involved in cell wall biosynthesis
MRILMLSWRYVDHPAAGGAEVVTHEVLRRFVARGMDVTCFTAAHPGGMRNGELDGVRLIRAGSQWTVHLHAWRWLRRRLHEFDRIVDQVNTIPFFTPLYARQKTPHLLIWQLAREYWFRQMRGPLRLVAPIGYVAEPWYLGAYRATPAVTCSESSAEDLRRLGIGDRGLEIVPLALPFEALDDLRPKSGRWRMIVVGRLTPAKFVEEAIETFAAVQAQVPEAELDVVGGGDPAYARRLQRRVEALRLRQVVFHGRVPEERKLSLLRDAHLHVFCSHREGWGLTVTEAAAMGTPTVGYDAPGVRDSIDDARLLAPIGDVRKLADRVLWLHAAPIAYEALRRRAWERASALSYERTAGAMAAALGVPWAAAGR